MKNIIASFALLLCITASSQPSRFNYATFKNNEGELNYRFLVPDGIERKLPLVIFLHGSGERGNDNEAQLKWGVMQFATDENMKYFPAYVVAPQCPADDQWANYNGKLGKEPRKPMKLVRSMIDDLIENFDGIDENRIYITGLSMGGYGTFDALARYPDLFAAGVPVCGSGDEGSVDRFKDIPLWIYTGAEDPVVPAEQTLKMLNALMDAGAKPGYTQVPETGHFSWLAAYSDPLLIQWMFRQRKN